MQQRPSQLCVMCLTFALKTIIFVQLGMQTNNPKFVPSKNYGGDQSVCGYVVCDMGYTFCVRGYRYLTCLKIGHMSRNRGYVL